MSVKNTALWAGTCRRTSISVISHRYLTKNSGEIKRACGACGRGMRDHCLCYLNMQSCFVADAREEGKRIEK